MYRIDKHGKGSKKKNPFFMFASEKKMELEQNGQQFRGGISDVVLLAGAIWKDMTEEDRQPYKLKANEWNANHLEAKLQKIQPTRSIAPAALREETKAPKNAGNMEQVTYDCENENTTSGNEST